jgi:tocopherol O-methyltransferase
MITPNIAQTSAAVALHYDELDEFYRDIWGGHVHHGYWATGREAPATAVEALTLLVAGRLGLQPGQVVADIGCGYGASARLMAARENVNVTGFTISVAQARAAAAMADGSSASIMVRDWLENGLASASFDAAYAIESSEHMPDKQRFFDEAFRVLRPRGRLVICAWLAADRPKPWEVKHLLEPICREGRLPGMGTEGDYRDFATRAGFRVTQTEDISAQVSRTWWICARRFLARLVTHPHYLKFLLNRGAANRIFALTLFRLLLAYRTKAMRYCVFTLQKTT